MRTPLFLTVLAPFAAPGLTAQEPAAALPELAAPFVVHADGAPIVAKTGHAAPYVVDLDGDGIRDLAVGEFGGGACRLYRNVGTNTEPRFEGFDLLLSDGKPAAMESS